MDVLHTTGVAFIQHLQNNFKDYDEWMLTLSHLGDPRNAFLIYFPITYCLHRRTGALVLWLASLSEWINALLKWVLHGERPYWWTMECGLYQYNTTSIQQYNTTVIQQYRLTCETGPGSPSGHAMVTASVIFCIISSLLSLQKSSIPSRCTAWCMFVVFMLCVCVSRCYIATHFPHQVLLGTVAGIFLTVVFRRANVQDFHIYHYLIVSMFIPASCLMTFFGLQMLNFDPQWSITMATKWCEKSEWVHLDTTPFNSIFRDAGSILGFGISQFILTRHSRAEKPTTMSVRLLHIIMSLVVCQVGENIKPSQADFRIYYFLTSLKFCTIVVMVSLITKLFQNYADNNKVKNH